MSKVKYSELVATVAAASGESKACVKRVLNSLVDSMEWYCIEGKDGDIIYIKNLCRVHIEEYDSFVYRGFDNHRKMTKPQKRLRFETSEWLARNIKYKLGQ